MTATPVLHSVDDWCEYPPFPCSSLTLRTKIFSSTPLEVERSFNEWMKIHEYEIVSVSTAAATAGSSEDQWATLILTVLYRDGSTAAAAIKF